MNTNDRPSLLFDDPDDELPIPLRSPIAAFLRSTAITYACVLFGTALAPFLIEHLVESGYYHVEGFYHLGLWEILQQIFYAVLVIVALVLTVGLWTHRGPFGTPRGAIALQLALGTTIVVAGSVPLFLTSQPGDLFGHVAPGWLTAILPPRFTSHDNLIWTMLLLGPATAGFALGETLHETNIDRPTLYGLHLGIPAVPFAIFILPLVPPPTGFFSLAWTCLLLVGFFAFAAKTIIGLNDLLLLADEATHLFLGPYLGLPGDDPDQASRDPVVRALAAGTIAIALGIALIAIIAALIARRLLRPR